MKKSLISGIIILLLGIGLVFYNEYLKNKNDIHTIVDSKSMEEGITVYLDATYVAGTITNDENNSYYVVFGDGFQYIVYMSDKEAIELSKYLLDNPENHKRIYGVTKKFPSEYVLNGIKFANTWLDNNHTHEEDGEENHVHDISEEDFYQYFGYVYIDNTVKINLVLEILMYVFCMVGLLFIFNYINTKYHFI